MVSGSPAASSSVGGRTADLTEVGEASPPPASSPLSAVTPAAKASAETPDSTPPPAVEEETPARKKLPPKPVYGGAKPKPDPNCKSIAAQLTKQLRGKSQSTGIKNLKLADREAVLAEMRLEQIARVEEMQKRRDARDAHARELERRRKEAKGSLDAAAAEMKEEAKNAQVEQLERWLHSKERERKDAQQHEQKALASLREKQGAKLTKQKKLDEEFELSKQTRLKKRRGSQTGQPRVQMPEVITRHVHHHVHHEHADKTLADVAATLPEGETVEPQIGETPYPGLPAPQDMAKQRWAQPRQASADKRRPESRGLTPMPGSFTGGMETRPVSRSTPRLFEDPPERLAGVPIHASTDALPPRLPGYSAGVKKSNAIYASAIGQRRKLHSR